jgi:hypothetical protein
LGGMSVGEQKSSGSLSDPLPPPSFSAPSQPSSTPNYPAPPMWQPAQRRVYPDAYNGPPPTVSSFLLCSLLWNSGYPSLSFWHLSLSLSLSKGYQRLSVFPTIFLFLNLLFFCCMVLSMASKVFT